MEINAEVKILRIFVSSTDKFRHTPLYETIVFAAKRYGLSGATVLRGVMGYGASSEIHSLKFWEATEKLPLVIEIVDESAKIDEFTEKIRPWLEKLPYGCLATVEKATVVFAKKGSHEKLFHR